MNTDHLDRGVPLVLAQWRFCPLCASSLVWRQGEPGALPNVACSECSFMHFANPYPTMNCMVLNERGQVLLVQRAHDPQAGSWCMPGGFIDAPAEGEPVESAQDAARRELMEEAGITASNWKCVNALPDWYNRERGVSTCNLCFLAVADPGQEPRCGSDAIDVGWFDQDDVAHRLAFDNQQQFYAEWLAEQDEQQKQRERHAEIEAERFLNLDER